MTVGSHIGAQESPTGGRFSSGRPGNDEFVCAFGDKMGDFARKALRSFCARPFEILGLFPRARRPTHDAVTTFGDSETENIPTR